LHTKEEGKNSEKINGKKGSRAIKRSYLPKKEPMQEEEKKT